YTCARFERESNCDCAGAGPDIDDVPCRPLKRRLDDMLSLRPWNQNIGSHPKLAAVELLPARDVLRGHALHALVQIAAVVNPPQFTQLFVRVSVKPGAITADSVRQQNFRVQPGSFDVSLLQQLLALEERRAEIHFETSYAAASPCLFW